MPGKPLPARVFDAAFPIVALLAGVLVLVLMGTHVWDRLTPDPERNVYVCVQVNPGGQPTAASTAYDSCAPVR